MFEPLRKLLLAGLGTIDLTEERARAIMDDLVSRGEMSEKEARELVSGWAKRAGEQRDRLQQQIDEAVRRSLQAVGVVRRSELDALTDRVARLERLLSKSEGENDQAPR
jgi:polyhydroxyalkanoate synthesis regulator phasin